MPSNTSSSVASVISSAAILQYYGHPCQGTQPGTTSTCGTLTVQNIWGAAVSNGEVFHPCDLTAAMTSTNSWNTTYRNKFVKVTNLSNGQSIVVRVTDTAPANQGIELTYRAWQSIGQPAPNSKSVKIELMS
jgi:rare lipoprotein A (peptidoglycan hydrolase)